MGLGSGILNSYVALHIQSLFEDPAQATVLVGVMQFIACTSEVVFFALSTVVLQKFGSRLTISVAAVCFATRFGYYALLTSPWFVLPIEFIHGVSWACFWAACQQYALSIAPPGLEGTLQGLLAGFYSGLGAGLGTFAGGFINKSLGAPALFWCISSWLLFASAVFFLFNKYLDRREAAAAALVSADEKIERQNLLGGDSVETSETELQGVGDSDEGSSLEGLSDKRAVAGTAVL